MSVSRQPIRRVRQINNIFVCAVAIYIVCITAILPVQASTVFSDTGSHLLDRINRTGRYEAEAVHIRYDQPDILVRQVVFDWDINNVLISVGGVPGEIYILRLSQGETSLVMQEQMYIEDGTMQLNMDVSLKKDLHYTFAIYDYYNKRHAEFTWRQPFDFEAAQLIFTPEYIEPEAKPLAKTDDAFNNPIFLSALLCIIDVCENLKKYAEYAKM